MNYREAEAVTVVHLPRRRGDKPLDLAQIGLTVLVCKPGISMPGLHALLFVDYSRYMVSS